MEYIKLYSEFNESLAGKIKNFFTIKKSFKNYLNGLSWDNRPLSRSCINLDIWNKNISNLDGIEDFINLKTLNCSLNELLTLEGIENLTNLISLNCGNNKLENLKGIEKLTNLETLDCRNNNLLNIDEIKNLNNIKTVVCFENPFTYPIPIEIENKISKYGASSYLQYVYDSDILEKFKSYDFQKEFLTKFPEKISDLKTIGIDKKIKQEFPALIRGIEWGFFDLEDKNDNKI